MNESWEDLLWRIYCDGYADGERIDRRPLSQIKPIAQGLERIESDEALMRQALEALEFEHGGEPLSGLTAKTIAAFRERLGEE